MPRISRLPILLLLLLLSSGIQAQEEQRDTLQPNRNLFSALAGGIEDVGEGMARTIRHTGRRIRKVVNNVDTNYISPNRYNLAFMLEHSTWYEHYRLGSKANEHRQSLNFAPNMGMKLGVYFGWRWIFLGYTFDVEDLFGGNKNKADKTEMSLNIYSSKFGVDLYYRKTGSDFKIRSCNGFNLSSPFREQDFGGLQSKIKGLNAYWIFNHRKFSYPAVYSQSTNQRKSAGSLMAGFSYSQHSIYFDYTQLPSEMQNDLNPNLRFSKVKYSDYSLGFGYGYNWVFRKNWVANLSLLPGIGFKKAKIDDAEYDDRHWIKDINFDLITRAGVTYNNSKYFIGASLVMHTYDYRKTNLSVTNSFGTLRVYAGFNFWKKREYRE